MPAHDASLTDAEYDRRSRTEQVIAVGQRVEVRVGAVAAGGGCVGRHLDGRVMFVRHSLPGELVIAEITAVTSSFLRADAVEVREAAPERQRPPCPHAGPGRCGGCDWQHIGLERQRELKADLVAEQLRRVAGTERSVVVEALPGEPSGLGWRTRMRFAVDADGTVGLRRHRSHAIEPTDHCPLSTGALAALGVEGARWPGVTELEAFAPEEGNGEATILAVPTREGLRVGDLPRDLEAGIIVEGHVIAPPRAVHTRVLGHRFRVSAGAFWQVHAAAPEVLGKALLGALGAKRGDRVVDLYAGAGLFSVLVAEEVGRDGRVIAVERNRAAVADARRNAAQLPQIEIWGRPVDSRLVGELGAVDLVILDPPREGAGRALTTALVALDPAPRRVLYLACDAASFARDLRVALDAGWSMRSLRAFDLFPMTEHVELLAVLEPPPEKRSTSVPESPDGRACSRRREGER